MQSDLSPCENEPIHAAGSIQALGVVLAFDVNSLTLGHPGRNTQDGLGPGAVTSLGSTSAEVLGSAAATALRNGLTEDRLVGHADGCVEAVSQAHPHLES
ncbi:MAG: hypothetical protein ABJC74_11470 [Gemmatimonadota bacterium]